MLVSDLFLLLLGIEAIVLGLLAAAGVAALIEKIKNARSGEIQKP